MPIFNPNYLEINKACWETRTDVHIQSEFYDVSGFIAGKSSLKEIEIEFLNAVHGKTVLHLQCHFGLDTLSLSRLGALVTGIDFSEKAIGFARSLATNCGLSADFVLTDVYSVPDKIEKTFDYVFTTYGTIGWLPDIQKWAAVIARMLKPGGKLIFIEFHPFVWIYDNDFTELKYDYFNSYPIVETENGTYTDTNAEITTQSIGFNHGLSEVVSALLSEGLVIEQFREYPYSPFECFPNMIEIAPSRFVFQRFGTKLPLTYALIARKS